VLALERRGRRVLRWDAREPARFWVQIRRLVGVDVAVMYRTDRAERGRLLPIQGTVTELHRHGFVVAAKSRHFVSYADLLSGRARLEVRD